MTMVQSVLRGKEMQVETGHSKLTYDDLLRLPDDGLRHEIIDGEHYVTPAPVTKHQRISRELLYLLVQLPARPRGGNSFTWHLTARPRHQEGPVRTSRRPGVLDHRSRPRRVDRLPAYRRSFRGARAAFKGRRRRGHLAAFTWVDNPAGSRLFEVMSFIVRRSTFEVPVRANG